MLKFGPETFCYHCFCYLRPIDSVLDTQGPFSQAVSRVMAEYVNREG